MSRASRKEQGLQKGAATQKQKRKTVEKSGVKKFFVFAAIFILAAIPFSMGKYFEFNSPGAFDSGAYVYSAKHVLDGARLGIDEKPGARVGTLLVNMAGVAVFGYNETGPKLIQMILQCGALVLMFVALRKLFGTFAASISLIIASVYLSAPLIAKYGNVKEQYMIAFMVLGVSCFVLRQLGGKWYLAVLAGAFAAWAPLFKETGISAIAAIGLFVLIQPLFRYRSWKQTMIDILLMIAGAVGSIGPVVLWLAGTGAPTNYWPYHFAWKILLTDGVKSVGGSYITKARQFSPFSEQYPRVLRYYWQLRLPIAMASGSIIAWLVRIILGGFGMIKAGQKKEYSRFVILFGLWWVMDMAFVWISPRSYEQYYLPLTASAAMAGGYLAALYRDKFSSSIFKGRWVFIGMVGFLGMIILSWHIFAGITVSPHSGTKYSNPDIRRGYRQKLKETKLHRQDKNLQGSWEVVGEYIKQHSAEEDKIYVWGWVPGIYVKAGRLSSASSAFTSEMHVISPQALSEMIAGLIADFERELPRFIVDTHKRHFPWDRPPLELWPIVPKGLFGNPQRMPLPTDKMAVAKYNGFWQQWLIKNVDEDEALRYEAMSPFREFVMNNYKIVQRPFGQHALFELKEK